MAGVSWKRTEKARELVQIEGRLAPKWVSVRSEGLVGSEGAKTRVELQFSTSAPDKFGPIVCMHMEAYGVIDSYLLAQIDFEVAARSAYSEWLDSPAVGDPTTVSVEAHARDFTEKARQIGQRLELSEVAWVYLQAPTRGTQNVLEALNYGSKATAIRRVADARKAGLIPPPGAPTEDYEKALEALRKERSSNA